jgi:Spy/CpxP family protein refolding chaperone
MSRSKQVVLATVAALLAVPALVLAAANAGTGPHHHDMAAHIAQQLNLTQDQQDKVKAIFASHKDQLLAGMTRVKQGQQQLFDAIHADTFDEAAIRAASQALATAQTEVHVLRGQIVSEVRAVLTPDQQAKAKELLAKHKAMAEQHFSHLQDHLSGDPLGLH